MPLTRLDHCSIRTDKLDETRAFYVDVLGLEVGPRPNFPFPGVWLYREGQAVIHVIGIDPNDPEGLKRYLGNRGGPAATGTGSIDHVAFAATDLPEMRKRVAAAGLKSRERTVPNMALYQLFVEDPNGVTIELNYDAAEAAQAA